MKTHYTNNLKKNGISLHKSENKINLVSMGNIKLNLEKCEIINKKNSKLEEKKNYKSILELFCDDTVMQKIWIF